MGRKSLKDGWPEIHEQEIGAKVFGRPDSYDRSSDNIVRVNATELRKRIDLYFESTGANEPLIFEIPRGGYTPVFRWRRPAVTEHTELAIEETAPPPSRSVSLGPVEPSHPRFVSHIAWALASLALAVACAFLIKENRTMRAALQPLDGKPAVAAFWTGFLSSHQRFDVVLPDDSTSVVEDITRRPTTLGDYLSRDYGWIEASDMSKDRKKGSEPDPHSQSGHFRRRARSAANPQRDSSLVSALPNAQPLLHC